MSLHQQDDETRQSHKATWKGLCWVLVLSGLIRCAVLVALSGNLERDPDAYRTLAINVVEHGVYGWKVESALPAASTTHDTYRPTAFRPPLYPLVLIAIGGTQSPLPIAVLHLVLGIATAGLVACLGWRAGLGSWAVVAALLVALDPILLQQSTLVMTETLATFLASLALYVLTAPPGAPEPRRAWWARSLATGVVLGLCGLCRPTFLPWLGLVALTWLCRRHRRSLEITDSSESDTAPRLLPVRLAEVVVLSGAALLVIMPWAIRNQLVLGKPKLTTTHGGYTVLLGNNPLFYDYLKSRSAGTWDGEQLSRAWQRRGLTTGPKDPLWSDLKRLAERAPAHPAGDESEFADDQLAYRLARRYVAEQPGMFAYASGLRMTRLWRLVPHQVGETESRARTTLRYLVGCWYAVVLGLVVVGIVQLGRRNFAAPWLEGYQLCLVFTVVHAVYWSDMRMRAPLMPLVCLVAASGMAALGDRIRHRKASN